MANFNVPKTVPWDAFRAAVDLLGLPGAVRSLTIDADSGVTATLIVCGSDGRKLGHGDDALTTTVNIPFSRD